ncbi:MAG: rod shape-determining protein MreC [Bdellovibrionales bacterium RBG_16_40_8]|nr:MAG: rod shape-determining protein MreC [Bdellovibrionales bacterium RBG_16_40_8]
MVAIPLLSVNLQQRSKDKPWILIPFFYTAGVTQNSYAAFSSNVRGTTDLYLNLINIKKTNRELTGQLAELKAQLGELTELKLENERLGHLLAFKQKTHMNLLASRIIGRDLLTDYETVTIDRGSSHGVKKGMGTLTINGVVGYITDIEPNTAKILLITDRYAVIDGVVQRSRARGIAQGLTSDSLTLSLLKRDDDVKMSDIIVTSGIDNYFPKGFPIGSVTKIIEKPYGLGQQVTLQPAVTTSDLEEIFVVLNANHQNFEE